MAPIIGCTDGTDSTNKKNPAERTYLEPHPRQESLMRRGFVAAEVALNATPDTGHPIYETLRRAKAQVTVGVLEGPPEKILGKIADVALDDAGRIFILDAGQHLVKVFDAQGDFLTQFGRAGSGPGEFTQPSRIKLIGGDIHILDITDVHIFSETGGSFAFSHALKSGLAEPVDICGMGRTTFLHAVSMRIDSMVLKFVDREIAGSLGQVYQDISPRAALTLNRSLIACGSAQNIVAVAPRSVLGEVHAFSADGDPSWIVRVTGYRPVTFEESSTGGARVSIPTAGYDRMATLLPFQQGFIAQVLFTSEADYKAQMRDYTSLYTFAILEDGRSISLGNAIPDIADINESGYAVVSNAPYPKVTIYAW